MSRDDLARVRGDRNALIIAMPIILEDSADGEAPFPSEGELDMLVAVPHLIEQGLDVRHTIVL